MSFYSVSATQKRAMLWRTSFNWKPLIAIRHVAMYIHTYVHIVWSKARSLRISAIRSLTVSFVFALQFYITFSQLVSSLTFPLHIVDVLKELEHIKVLFDCGHPNSRDSVFFKCSFMYKAKKRNSLCISHTHMHTTNDDDLNVFKNSLQVIKIKLKTFIWSIRSNNSNKTYSRTHAHSNNNNFLWFWWCKQTKNGR